MTSHWIGEGGVKLKGLVLVCLLLVSLFSLLVLIRPGSAELGMSPSRAVGQSVTEFGAPTSIVDNTPPPTPVLLSPSYGSSTTDSTPTFEWTSVYDPSSVTYTLAYMTSNWLKTVTIVEGLTDNTYTVPDNAALPENTYHWQVRAVDGAGNASNWSKGWWFRVTGSIAVPKGSDTTPPPTPALISPLNLVLVRDSTPLLDWSDVSDPSGVTYHLQVWRGRSNRIGDTSDRIVYDKSGIQPSQHELENALLDGIYFWQVQAVDGAGNQSNWSNSWQFIVSNVVATQMRTNEVTYRISIKN